LIEFYAPWYVFVVSVCEEEAIVVSLTLD